MNDNSRLVFTLTQSGRCLILIAVWGPIFVIKCASFCRSCSHTLFLGQQWRFLGLASCLSEIGLCSCSATWASNFGHQLMSLKARCFAMWNESTLSLRICRSLLQSTRVICWCVAWRSHQRAPQGGVALSEKHCLLSPITSCTTGAWLVFQNLWIFLGQQSCKRTWRPYFFLNIFLLYFFVHQRCEYLFVEWFDLSLICGRSLIRGRDNGTLLLIQIRAQRGLASLRGSILRPCS